MAAEPKVNKINKHASGSVSYSKLLLFDSLGYFVSFVDLLFLFPEIAVSLFGFVVSTRTRNLTGELEAN